jgi:hypothetical protein
MAVTLAPQVVERCRLGKPMLIGEPLIIDSRLLIAVLASK